MKYELIHSFIVKIHVFRLLENLIEYRQNKNSRYKDYNPLEVLLGIKSWQQIELKVKSFGLFIVFVFLAKI